MFNLYQSINKKDQQDEKEKELPVIGHERWYQERTSRSSSLKKKKKRSQSAAEFSNGTLNAATKRAAFHHHRIRSQSSENKTDDELNNDGNFSLLQTKGENNSLAKVFFGCKRQSNQSKHEYCAVKTDCGTNEKFHRGDIREGNYNSALFSVCRKNLNNERYELKNQLGDLGFRRDKNWFTIQDKIFGTERMLTLTPIPSTTCPIIACKETRETLIELFRGLQHPYIFPVLDIDFWKQGAAIICPLNQTGSLKDLIYGTCWQNDYDKKYVSKGEGLPLRTIQCLGRQIIEALLFLRNKQFPPIYHLHSGNVIIQNGVARLAGLENPFLGLLPKSPSASVVETLAFGYLLFEMTMGYELPGPPRPAHLQLELDRFPKIAETLELIFQTTRTPSLEELIRCDLFRGVELRELRGASMIQISSAPSEVLHLLDIVKSPFLPNHLVRRQETVVVIEDCRRKTLLEDILEEDTEFSDNSSCSSSSSSKFNIASR